MQILHGTWIPDSGQDFIRSGMFCLWVETTEKKRFRKPNQRHPRQLAGEDLATLLANELGIKPPNYRKLEELIQPKFFLLPTGAGQPLPSLELSLYLEDDLPEDFDFEYWQVDCYPTLASTKTSSYGKSTVNNVVPLLNDLHFIAMHNLTEIQLGGDLLFWFHFTQTLKRIIFKDQYIPSLKYRELDSAKASRTKRKPKTGGNAKFEIYPGWEFIGEEYETALQQYVDYMPMSCAAGFPETSKTPEFYDRRSLLRHFADCLLTDIITHTYTTQGYEKTIADSVVYACLKQTNGGTYWTTEDRLEQFKQWQAWRDRIVRTQTDQPFYLYFHLQDPVKPEAPWQLQFQVAPKQDPSLKVSLDDYWRLRPQQQEQVKTQMGGKFEQNLLLNLGYAARIYPDLWEGLETDQPIGITLDLDAAFNFLKESAWVLENAGYKVIVPAWWTPKGRQRAKVRPRPKVNP